MRRCASAFAFLFLLFLPLSLSANDAAVSPVILPVNQPNYIVLSGKTAVVCYGVTVFSLGGGMEVDVANFTPQYAMNEYSQTDPNNPFVSATASTVTFSGPGISPPTTVAWVKVPIKAVVGPRVVLIRGTYTDYYGDPSYDVADQFVSFVDFPFAPQGPQGATGAQGATGPQGPPGPAGPSGFPTGGLLLLIPGSPAPQGFSLIGTMNGFQLWKKN